MSSRLILFGGTFNPIHNGHLISARSAAEKLQADRVVLIPSLNPPHRLDESLPAATVRLEMAKLAVDGDPIFEVSDTEIQRGGTSFTFDTVSHFRSELGQDAELIWLIGADTLPELATWHRTEELIRICRVVTLRRPGWEAPDLGALRLRLGDDAVQGLQADAIESDRIGISATEIRRRVAAGTSIRYLVPESVERHIREAGLYSDTPKK